MAEFAVFAQLAERVADALKVRPLLKKRKGERERERERNRNKHVGAVQELSK